MATITVLVPTTILATVTHTVTSIATSTATKDPHLEIGLFRDSFWGCMVWVNLSIICTSILVMFIIGHVNRLSLVPLVSASCGCLANGLNYYGWTEVWHSMHARRMAVMMSMISFIFMSLSLTLYSYFLLDKILQGTQRRIFRVVFWLLFLGVMAVRTAAVPVDDVFWTDPEGFGSRSYEISYRLEQVTRSGYILISLLETWSAYFLIKAFHKARINSRALGGRQTKLFTSMMQSSEIRVATLVTWSLVRAACWRSTTPSTDLMKQLDRFAFTMINCYPIVLQIDLVASKMLRYQASLATQDAGLSVVCPPLNGPPGNAGTPGYPEVVSPGAVTGNPLGRIDGKGAVDSLTADFDRYGMGWKGIRNGSITSLWTSKRKGSNVNATVAVEEIAEGTVEVIGVSDHDDIEKHGRQGK